MIISFLQSLSFKADSFNLAKTFLLYISSLLFQIVCSSFWLDLLLVLCTIWMACMLVQWLILGVPRGEYIRNVLSYFVQFRGGFYFVKRKSNRYIKSVWKECSRIFVCVSNKRLHKHIKNHEKSPYLSSSSASSSSSSSSSSSTPSSSSSSSSYHHHHHHHSLWRWLSSTIKMIIKSYHNARSNK